jgi:hypothetical protein
MLQFFLLCFFQPIFRTNECTVGWHLQCNSIYRSFEISENISWINNSFLKNKTLPKLKTGFTLLKHTIYIKKKNHFKSKGEVTLILGFFPCHLQMINKAKKVYQNIFQHCERLFLAYRGRETYTGLKKLLKTFKLFLLLFSIFIFII